MITVTFWTEEKGVGERVNTEYLSVLVTEAKQKCICHVGRTQAREDRKDKRLHLCSTLLSLVCVRGLAQHIGKCILMRQRSSGG